MIDKLTHPTFARQVNTQFRVNGHGAGVVMLELVDAGELRSSDRGEAFAIVFRGPHDVVLPQAIYHFQHDAMGAFDLFIVPILRDQQSLLYEAVFNRLRQLNGG